MDKKLRKLINRKFLLYPNTDRIIEVREEMYSIMLDKYNDCLNSGMSKQESYKKATEMMADYKSAIREVETGSSLSGLKRNLTSLAFFSLFYFMAVTFVYLFVSMVVIERFEDTWLITVGGAFVYLLYFAVCTYNYARLFNFHTLQRWGTALIFFTLIPVLYVFPSLYLFVVQGKNVWSISWLIVLVIGFLYLLVDYMAYKKNMSVLERYIRFLGAGFLVTTCFYVAVSVRFQLWGTAWIVYLLYLAIVSLVLYIGERRKKV